MAQHFQVYTDGSCLSNNVKTGPSPGGWAAVVLGHKGFDEVQIAGGELNTTNNIMEMTAVIQALSLLAVYPDCSVEILTDSMYVIKGCTEWRYGWIARNWRKADGGMVLNKELWSLLFTLLDNMSVTFTKVKGHSGNKYNDLCDALACAESRRFSEKIKI